MVEECAAANDVKGVVGEMSGPVVSLTKQLSWIRGAHLGYRLDWRSKWRVSSLVISWQRAGGFKNCLMRWRKC